MEYKLGDKFRYNGKNYLVHSGYKGFYTVVDLDRGVSERVRTDGTEEKLVATYAVDNTILLSDVKIGDKFKYNSYTYVKIDPIRVVADDCRVYTAKCVGVEKSYYDYDIGRGFCIPLDRVVECVKD